MLDKVRHLVKQMAEEEDWKYHIVPVVHNAKLLAKKMGVNEEVAELAALLHDVGRLRFGDKDHDITGVPEAEKILKKHGYHQEVIEEIKHCVASHRGSKDVPPKSTIAKIVANADAMAHFDAMPIFFFWRSKNGTFEEAFDWVDRKIARDWDKKLTLPEAKAMVAEKFKAIKVVLDSTRKYR